MPSFGETHWSPAMSDPKAVDPKATPAENAQSEEHHVAKKGQKDAGEIVTTMGGELMDGRIADITDGDR